MSASSPRGPTGFWLLAALLVVGIAWGSRAPWTRDAGSDGLVRISLSARPDRIEVCRSLSEEELAARPAHMRQAVICEGLAARYRLTVTRDGQPMMTEELTGGGARSDRPLHFLREFPLAPGSHHLSVRFHLVDSLANVDTDPDSPAAHRQEAEERNRRQREAVPARLELDTTISVVANRVVLIAYDPQARRLIALDSPRPP
ncbi:MAG: hypothetical protein SGI84_08425 [Gemmatimonadota bacterium]|nr:hypothetical protein [Gemmatimonadota bacterium]